MIDWSNVEVVEVPPPILPRASCPNCGSIMRIIIRTVTDADGPNRRCVCKRCSTPFLELVNPELCASDWQDSIGGLR
jgi:hypothetical protein